jgi:uncharacterized protein (DUF488 family)
MSWLMLVYTIGHSTRDLNEFVAILKKYGVQLLVDVRTVPRSRHTPQFNRDTLPEVLAPTGIAYRHMPALGGLRKAAKDSPNMGWRNDSFRGYADYMQTNAFSEAIVELMGYARECTAIMCAEAVPWRCHRSLIGDALLVRGVQVIDIFDINKSEPEKLTSFSQVNGTQILYPRYETDTLNSESE